MPLPVGVGWRGHPRHIGIDDACHVGVFSRWFDKSRDVRIDDRRCLFRLDDSSDLRGIDESRRVRVLRFDRACDAGVRIRCASGRRRRRLEPRRLVVDRRLAGQENGFV